MCYQAFLLYKQQNLRLKYDILILLVTQAVNGFRLEVLLAAFYFASTRFNLKGAKILHDLSMGAKNLHDLTRFEF